MPTATYTVPDGFRHPSGKRRARVSGATRADVEAQIAQLDAELVEAPSLGGFVKQGAVTARMNLSGMALRGAQRLAGSTWNPETGEMEGGLPLVGPTLAHLDFEPETIQRATEDALGGAPVEPETRSEFVAQGVGEAFSFPETLALGGTKIALEGASALTSGVAAGLARSENAPWWVETLASIAGGMAPGVSARQMASGGGQRAAVTAARDASVTPGSLQGRSADAIQQASANLKTAIPEHPTQPGRFVDEAVERLDEAAREAPFGERPTTSQALAELGGETMESKTAALSRGDEHFSRELAGHKLAAREGAERALGEARGSGGFDDFVRSYEDGLETTQNAARQLWDEVPLEEMPYAPTRGLQEAAERVAAPLREAGLTDELPAEFAAIMQHGDQVSMQTLQLWRSRLLRTARAGGHGADAVAQSRAVHANKLVGVVDEAIEKAIDFDGASAAQGEAYKRARDAWRDYKELYPDKSPISRLMRDPKEATNVARRVLSAGPDEADRLLRGLDPGGQQALRGVVMDELIRPDNMAPGVANRAIERIRQNRRTFETLWGGADGVRDLQKLLVRVRSIGYGRAGTPAAALGTGTGTQDPILALMRNAEITNPGARAGGSMTREIVTEAYQYVKSRTDADYVDLMTAALKDPEMAADLLRLPGPAELPAWAQRMNAHLLRAGLVRPGLSQGGGATYHNEATRGR